MQVRPQNHKIISIQILRAIACLLVLQLHVFKTIPFTSIVLNGAFGVDVFFVISGYIIAASIDRVSTVKPVSSFFINRFSRVIPYYYLITIVCILLVLATHMPLSADRIIKSFLFVPQGDDPVLILGWSLNHEIFFYVFIGLSLLVTRNLRVIAGLFLACLLTINVVPGEHYPLNFLKASINFTFLLGFVIYVFRGEVIPLFRSNFLLIVAVVASVAAMVTSNEVPLTRQHELIVPTQYYYFRDIVFINGLPIAVKRIFIYGIPAAFLFLTVVAREKSLTLRKKSLLVKIGDASYSLYLIQAPFIFFIWKYKNISPLYLLLLFILIIITALRLLKVENFLGNFVKERLSQLFLK